MNLSLKGKRAIVCGSTQGIGKSIAIKFAENGASVTLIARNENKLKNVIDELSDINSNKHNYIVSDFNDIDILEKNFTDYLDKGFKPSILINNTGGPPPGEISKASKKDFENYMSMHLHTSHYLSTSLLPIMKKEKYGRIVNIISVSVKAPIDNLGVSNTVRWAMASWAKTLSNEVAKDGITVNNILPGFTDTERLRSLLKNRALASKTTIKEITNNTISNIPARRFGKPEEVADATTFLCSKAANYINGINLPIDGGFSKSL
jgi:3-oxoacyl-[acyl-carrier protein] reductase